MSEYIENLLTAIDQLGNAIAGGDPDVTVSSRVGFHAYSQASIYWRTMERIIDFTFEPIDGKNHCFKSTLKDNDKDLNVTSLPMFFILAVIATLTCIVIAPIIRVFSYSKKLLLSCRTK
jgi:hypothetical protein